MSQNKLTEEIEFDGMTVTLDAGANLRCPGCGNEDTDAMDTVLQHYPSGSTATPDAVRCGECGASEHPYSWNTAFRFDRMSEEELKNIKAAEERGEAAAVAWQESAGYLHEQAERHAGR